MTDELFVSPKHRRDQLALPNRRTDRAFSVAGCFVSFGDLSYASFKESLLSFWRTQLKGTFIGRRQSTTLARFALNSLITCVLKSCISTTRSSFGLIAQPEAVEPGSVPSGATPPARTYPDDMILHLS